MTLGCCCWSFGSCLVGCRGFPYIKTPSCHAAARLCWLLFLLVLSSFMSSVCLVSVIHLTPNLEQIQWLFLILQIATASAFSTDQSGCASLNSTAIQPATSSCLSLQVSGVSRASSKAVSSPLALVVSPPWVTASIHPFRQHPSATHGSPPLHRQGTFWFLIRRSSSTRYT